MGQQRSCAKVMQCPLAAMDPENSLKYRLVRGLCQLAQVRTKKPLGSNGLPFGSLFCAILTHNKCPKLVQGHAKPWVETFFGWVGLTRKTAPPPF